jgi:hypothetical protein
MRTLNEDTISAELSARLAQRQHENYPSSDTPMKNGAAGVDQERYSGRSRNRTRAWLSIRRGTSMVGTAWLFRLRGMLLIFGLTAGLCRADEPAAPGEPVTSMADLKRLNRSQIEAMYAGAEPGAQPVGFARGEFLFLTETSLPRLKKGLIGAIWKGKHFSEDGGFINQFAGFRAVRSQVATGPSHIDGRPSLILEYPEKTPYFGNMRDEVREVAPGVYLSMLFDRATPPRLQGCLGLELEPPKTGR